MIWWSILWILCVCVCVSHIPDLLLTSQQSRNINRHREKWSNEDLLSLAKREGKWKSTKVENLKTVIAVL